MIEPATMGDLDAIMALEEAGFGPASRWIRRSWMPELTGTGHYVSAARDADGALQGVAAFHRVGEVADLNRVIVAPLFRGRGIGRALLECGCGWAVAGGAERMLLEVEPDNEAALGLYRAFGFLDVATRANYYGAGRNALVMQKELVT